MKTIRLTEIQLNRIVEETLRRINEEARDFTPDEIEEKEWGIGTNIEKDYNDIKDCKKFESGNFMCFTFPQGMADEVWAAVEPEMDEKNYEFHSLEDDGDYQVLKFEKKLYNDIIGKRDFRLGL